MPSNTTYDLNQLRDFSSIFMRNEVKSWLQGDFSSLEIKAQRYSNCIPKSGTSTYLNFIRHAYKVLEKNYQNEYIYKNSFLTEWLIKQLGETESMIFSEFRVGNSIADLAMFNGVSKAFEIKTEFDSVLRLESQLKDYKRAFNEVYLIVPKNKLTIYEKFDLEVGVIAFDGNKLERFELIRKSKLQEKIDAPIIMDVLHTKEYKKIVVQYFGELPEMDSFNQYKICFDLIQSIPIETLNQLYLDQIKQRKHDINLSSHHYWELNQISLALKLRKNEKSALISRLKNPIKL